MYANRRDLVRLAALAASALALPALADTRPLEPMRLLILGGTGFIGPHQVRYALARGHHVTIFNRGRQKEAWPGPVEELIGDRSGDLKALEGRDWDVCIDNPTSLPAWVRDAASVLKGHVDQYVFISTISVYAANDKPADETAPLAAYKGADPMAETTKSLSADPRRLYGPLKALSEKEAQTQYGKAATTIIRPSLIAGPGDQTDRFTYWPVRLARGAKSWHRAMGAIRCSSSTCSTWPNGLSAWPSSASPACLTQLVPLVPSRWAKCRRGLHREFRSTPSWSGHRRPS